MRKFSLFADILLAGVLALTGCGKPIIEHAPNIANYEALIIDNQTSASTIVYEFNVLSKTINRGEKVTIHALQIGSFRSFEEIVTPYFRENSIIKIVNNTEEKVLSDAIWEMENWDFFSDENVERRMYGSHITADGRDIMASDGNPINTYARTYEYTLILTDELLNDPELTQVE